MDVWDGCVYDNSHCGEMVPNSFCAGLSNGEASDRTNGCFCKLGVLFVGVLVIAALTFGFSPLALGLLLAAPAREVMTRL